MSPSPLPPSVDISAGRWGVSSPFLPPRWSARVGNDLLANRGGTFGDWERRREGGVGPRMVREESPPSFSALKGKLVFPSPWFVNWC
ncbi:hypothetical protein Sjap_014452 [Stephania japonica]|uniref:Uncharacterized protein n=1 Tax=Stephania japonica TaxID=461633 RepID=A0AAP0IHP6_9MAGN